MDAKEKRSPNAHSSSMTVGGQLRDENVMVAYFRLEQLVS